MDTCPGCGKQFWDVRVLNRHYAHSYKCQYNVRDALRASQPQQQPQQQQQQQQPPQPHQEELQPTLRLDPESSVAAEEDAVPTSSLSCQQYTVPLLACELVLPREQQHVGTDHDDFPFLLGDDEIDCLEEFGDGEVECGGVSSRVASTTRDDVVNDSDSRSSSNPSESLEPEEEFDAALDVMWESLQQSKEKNPETDFHWNDTLEEREYEDYQNDTLEEAQEEEEQEETVLEQGEEELPASSGYVFTFPHIDNPPPAQFEAPPLNQEDDDVQVEALLLALVQQFGCSLDGYQSIMEWAAFAQEKGYKFGRVEREKSRRAVMQRMIKRLDMECLKPISMTIPLVDDSGPKAGAGRRRGAADPTPDPAPSPKKSEVTATIPIVMYNFEELLDSILGDKTLMVSESLLLNPNDPYSKYPEDGAPLDDVLSGSWYHETWLTLELGEGDFLCPIIFFIDKTHTDHFGRFTLEPIRFTLGIFKRATRALSKAWRTLGFLTDLQKGSSAQNKHMKVRAISVPPEQHPPISVSNNTAPFLFVRPQISKTTIELRRSS
jgi:hypothetical protein